MSFRIAAAQSRSSPGDFIRNVAHHLEIAQAAARHSVNLLIFPELSLTGYELDLAAANAVRSDSPELEPLRAFSADTGMTIAAGAPLRHTNGKLYIAAILFHPTGAPSIYTKVHVHESEQHVFTPGFGGPLLDFGAFRVALAICADAKHPSHAAAAARSGANVYAAGAMIVADEYPLKASLIEGYAREHRMATLLANYSGASGGWLSPGRSAFWSDTGEQLAACPTNEEALVIATNAGQGWTATVHSIP